MLTPVLLLCWFGTTLASRYTPTPHGALIALPSGINVELAVEGQTSFRVSVSNGTIPAQLSTSMIAPKSTYAQFTILTSGSLVNLSAPTLGSLSIDTTTSILILCGPTGDVLTTTSGPLATFSSQVAWPYLSGPPIHSLVKGASGNDTCIPRRNDTDVTGSERSQKFPNGLSGKTEDECCAACNSDPTCIAWVWSDGSKPDPAGNCWPLSGYGGVVNSQGRVLGGFTPPPPPPPPGTTLLPFTTSPTAIFMGSGTDGGGATKLTRTGAQAQVFNTGSWTPTFYCSDGWGMMGVSPFPNTAGAAPGAANGVYGVSWAANPGDVRVSILGGSGTGGANVDLYLFPAPTLRHHVGALSALQGPAAVPPRYTLGFLACRWGWANQSYIEDVLAEFRAGSFPLDAFISDFEWFTLRPDYTLPSTGDPNYHDFSYNNITFPPPAAALIAHYRSAYNARFGGIRKPRFGNSDLLVMGQSKGWLMGQGGDPNGKPNGSRNTNFSFPEFFDYYTSANNQYLQDGVQFYWNDEGEDSYFTFTQWSAAQSVGLKAFDPDRRYFSINRAFAPGAASIGAIAWTGDIHDTWGDLVNTPGYFLNWGISGQPWVTCDTGGFSGDEGSILLSRWYGVASLMPIMRVHSVISSPPHFPFPELWGEEASGAMRSHLNRRYALLPLTYSLAHVARLEGVPMARPLALAFPGDGAAVADMTSQWMVGEGLLVAPVLSQDNTTGPVYLPSGVWYPVVGLGVAPGGGGGGIPPSGPFIPPASIQGPTTLPSLTGVPLDTVPLWAAAGTILTTAIPGPGLQFTDALPGGPLQVWVYPGSDGTFTLFEDDGETRAYEGGGGEGGQPGVVATTTFTWVEGGAQGGCLNWVTGGATPNPAGPKAFTQLALTVMDPKGVKRSGVVPLTQAGGKVCPTGP